MTVKGVHSSAFSVLELVGVSFSEAGGPDKQLVAATVSDGILDVFTSSNHRRLSSVKQ